MKRSRVENARYEQMYADDAPVQSGLITNPMPFKALLYLITKCIDANHFERMLRKTPIWFINRLKNPEKIEPNHIGMVASGLAHIAQSDNRDEWFSQIGNNANYFYTNIAWPRYSELSNEAKNAFSKYPTINQILPGSPLNQCQAVQAAQATTSTRSKRMRMAENVDDMDDNDDEEAVNTEDFRLMSIYPTSADILCDLDPIIYANIVDGKYVGGIDHYLNTQFRLLREDFIRPLRKSISQYRYNALKVKSTAAVASNFSIGDVKLYQNIKILKSSGRLHTCKFDCAQFPNVRWEKSKRLMHGSLVCISSNDFDTFVIATVAHRVDLAAGRFQVRLEDSSMLERTPITKFDMIESPVYFEVSSPMCMTKKGKGKHKKITRDISNIESKMAAVSVKFTKIAYFTFFMLFKYSKYFFLWFSLEKLKIREFTIRFFM